MRTCRGVGLFMVEATRGGPGRGQGRKPIKQGEDTVTVSLRMTVTQRDKLALLGGAEWVRQRIDKAKAPNAEVSGTAAASSPQAPLD
jgi:hypothetical protein